MKKRGYLLLLILLCMFFTIINFESIFEPKVVTQKQVQNSNNDEIKEKSTSKDPSNKEIIEKQIYQGNLLLVNRSIPVQPESIKSDVINLSTQNELTKGFELTSNEIYLSEDIAHRFSEMITDAEKDGVRNFCINSGFRDFEKQNKLYEEIGSDYALPAGHSEHNLGLSIDVGSTQMKMADAPEGKWLEDNAWKYGFILRYPRDKTDVTGIQFEPWHIRYVGLPHSAIMKEKNFVLEEYLDYLKQEKQFSNNINGKKYTITYYPISQYKEINIRDTSNYEISGNNTDGVIVTVNE